MKRFVTAVFKHETNTFSPVPTPIGAFGRYAGESGPVYGEEALAAYRGTNTPVAAFIDLAAGAELVFPVAANANPSGRAPDSVLDHCAERICEAVRSRCDAAFLDLHGGMATQGHDDPEGELLRRVRAVAPELPIAVALDFHSNLSAATIDNATVVTGYRTYPHLDAYETGERAGRTLLRTLAGEVAPTMVWHSLPILTHLSRQTPSRQPMKDIMDRAIAAEASGEVLNASVFGCVPLADIPHVGLHAVVVADAERGAGERLLQELMSTAWARRAEFVFEVEPVEASIARARTLTGGPVLLADHGDVAGSGGSTDVMAVLAEAMRQGLDDLCAGPYCDPEAVARMVDAGLGAEVTLELGGKVDFPAIGLGGQPLRLTGRVRRITDGTFTVTGPMFTGTVVKLGRTVVFDTGKAELVVGEIRHEPFDTGCFTHAGIDPARKRYILIKSRQHFRAGFEPIIAHVVMVSGPGITTSDYGLLPWKNVRRPVYPLDPDTEPNLPVATERTPRAEGA
jgi:microcystin degradation protein MlrC